jgi:FAD synthase
MRFSSLEELKAQIHRDIESVREYFRNLVLVEEKE